MSFAVNINTVLNANADINNLVTGIYHQIAPDNQNLKEAYVVFNYRLTGSVDTIEKYNHLDIYDLEIYCFANNTETLNTITESFRAYLDNYQDANMLDFNIISDERDVEGDKEQYNNLLEYKIIYKN